MKKDTYFTPDNIEKLNFLLRAKLDDYCLPDGTIVHLDGLLYDYFKRELGYDNIVFFSPNKGLYFFDDETYEYFCPKTETGDITKIAPLSANVGALQSRRSRNADGEGGPLAVTTQEEISERKVLRFTLSVKEAFPLIDRLIKDKRNKNVVVIKDAVSFLESVGEQSNGSINQSDEAFFLRNWDNLLLDRAQNRNILVWVTMGRDNVAGYPYFRDRNATENTPQLAKEKVTIIEASVIGVGEIKNLINHYRLRIRERSGSYVLSGFRVDFGDYERLCSVIAEKMLRYGLALRDLCDIFDELSAKGLILNIANFNVELREKLVSLKLKFEKDESYTETLAKYDEQPKVLEFIESVKRKAEGFRINEQRAAMGDSRLDPPQKTDFQRLLARQQNAFNLHLALVGPPGTGKTTFAKVIAKAYRELGLLPSEKFVKVTRADLVGAYIGHTAIKTRSVIDGAMGGTLFIDEAYTLARSGTNGNDFGLEAIDTLVEAMTDRMGEFAVIIAGYENDIKKMISANEGLQSRFSSIISMTPYPVETLERKFVSTIRDIAAEYGDMDADGIVLSTPLRPCREGGLLGTFIEALQRDYDLHRENGRSGWASMRTVIQLATNVINNCSRRLSKEGLRRGEVMIDDLPEHECGIYLSILPKERPTASGLAAESEAKPEASSGRPFTFGQISHWYLCNPAFLFNGVRDEKFRAVYQSAVVKLYSGSDNCGTGCIFSPDGYILTAKHVAVGVDMVRIFRKIGEETFTEDHPVKCVWESGKYDIAVMQIADGTPTPLYASFWLDGAKRYAEKETRVSIMGYPFGIEAIDGPIYYKGLVAGVNLEALDRDSSDLVAMLNLQIEGKRGNSGSPLFNEKMEIIGVFVGSTMRGDESLMEEINRALPIRYFFDEFVG